MKTRYIPIALVLLMALSSGCLWAPELDGVRKDLQTQLPGASFDKEFAITLDPVGIALVKLVTKFTPDTEEARMYLSDVSQVKVAIYEADNVPADAAVKMPERLKRLLERKDWELAVRVSEGGESVWVLYKADGDTIRELYVVVLSPEELVMVKARGRLDKLCSKVFREEVDLHDHLKI